MNEVEDRLVRLEVSNYLWTLCEEVAKLLRTTPKGALHQLLVSITEGLEQGQLGVLPFTWERARKSLERRGVLGDNEPTPIDISKLHQSDKIKSGFVGVYVNGAKGFSARGKNPAGPSTIYLGTFPTAEEAAWARYRHYKQHGLAYGRLEEEIDKLRQEEAYRTMSDDRLKHHVIWEAANLFKRPLEDLTTEERELERVDPITGKQT